MEPALSDASASISVQPSAAVERRWSIADNDILLCDYTWDPVTSVNLNISMVRYLRHHLVCTVHCLHEQEWWLLVRWSCEKVVRHLIFDKVKSFVIDSCLYEIPKNDWVDDTKLCHRSRSPMCCYLIVAPVDFTGEKLKAYNFVISRICQVTTGVEAQFCLSFQRCVHRHSCWLSQAKPAHQ